MLLRHTIVLLGTLFITPCIQAQSLEQVLQAVKENNLSLKEAKATLQSETEALAEVRASYLPTVSLQGTIRSSSRDSELQNGTLFDENTTPLSATVQLSQNLYAGGRRHLNAQRAITSLKAQKNAILDSELSLSSEAVQLYHTLALTKQVLKVRLETANVLEQQLQAAIVRQSKGDGTYTDVAQTKARVAEAKAQIGQEQLRIKQLKAELSALANIEIRGIQPLISTELPFHSLEEAIDLAIRNNPALKAAGLNVQSSRIDTALAARENMPTVNLSGQATTFRESSPTIDRDDELSIGITFSLPLYNGGLTPSRTRRAASSHRAARFAQDQLRQNIERQISNIWNSRLTSITLIEARKLRVQAADEALTGIQRGKDAGLFDNLDVLNAVEEKNNARISLLEAENEYQLASYLLLINTDTLIR